jgi:hypothetical protein
MVLVLPLRTLLFEAPAGTSDVAQTMGPQREDVLSAPTAWGKEKNQKETTSPKNKVLVCRELILIRYTLFSK